MNLLICIVNCDSQGINNQRFLTDMLCSPHVTKHFMSKPRKSKNHMSSQLAKRETLTSNTHNQNSVDLPFVNCQSSFGINNKWFMTNNVCQVHIISMSRSQVTIIHAFMESGTCVLVSQWFRLCVLHVSFMFGQPGTF